MYDTSPVRSASSRGSLKSELTVAEAAVVTQRSIHTIYRWIRSGKLWATETTAGMTVRTDRLLDVAAKAKPGRPRVR